MELEEGISPQAFTLSEMNPGDGANEERSAGLMYPSRNTGPGVIICGEVNRITLATIAKANAVHARRRLGVNSAVITDYVPEAGRSSPGQNEEWRKPLGGSNLQ